MQATEKELRSARNEGEAKENVFLFASPLDRSMAASPNRCNCTLAASPSPLIDKQDAAQALGKGPT